MERSWGDKRLAVFDEAEAQKWVLGVRIPSTELPLRTGPPKLQVRVISSNLLIRTLPLFTVNAVTSSLSRG